MTAPHTIFASAALAVAGLLPLTVSAETYPLPDYDGWMLVQHQGAPWGVVADCQGVTGMSCELPEGGPYRVTVDGVDVVTGIMIGGEPEPAAASTPEPVRIRPPGDGVLQLSDALVSPSGVQVELYELSYTDANEAEAYCPTGIAIAGNCFAHDANGNGVAVTRSATYNSLDGSGAHSCRVAAYVARVTSQVACLQ